MNAIMDRLAEITDAARAAVVASTLERKGDVLVTNDGRDVDTMQVPAAGAVVVHSLPAVEMSAPKVWQITWTISIVCPDPSPVAASERILDLTDLLYQAGVVRWTDRGTPTDFKRGDGASAVTIPGYSITHTEDHRR